jgi:hypothetical protein
LNSIPSNQPLNSLKRKKSTDFSKHRTLSKTDTYHQQTKTACAHHTQQIKDQETRNKGDIIFFPKEDL